MIRVKRIYEEPDMPDGMRILIDRRCGRAD